MTKAPIVEIFETIQGEGKTIGIPSTFVRFYGCNLRCQFAGIECDTPYAVYKEKDKAVMKEVEQVVQNIKDLKPKHIVWTGGEPTMFQPYIVEVMKHLIGYTCEVETNGTMPLKDDFKFIVNQFNVSAKLASSNQINEAYDKRRINDDALSTFPEDKSYFKFVVSSKNDLEEVLDLHQRYPNLEVYLMPEGMSRKAIIDHSQEVVDLCLEHNFKFSPREHIIIWDYKRGV